MLNTAFSFLRFCQDIFLLRQGGYVMFFFLTNMNQELEIVRAVLQGYSDSMHDQCKAQKKHQKQHVFLRRDNN